MILLVETHVNRRRSRNFVRSLGRAWSGVFHPGTGRSGGLLVAWKLQHFDVALLYSADHVMHLFVTDASQQSWLTSLIYGSNKVFTRNSLWNQLSQIRNSDFPWLIVGDFNCVLF